MEASVIRIRTPPLFTETANILCEGWWLSGTGVKHILLVKLCKHSSCSHQSLESYVAAFFSDRTLIELGGSGVGCALAMWATWLFSYSDLTLGKTQSPIYEIAWCADLLSKWDVAGLLNISMHLIYQMCLASQDWSLYSGLLTGEVTLLLLAKSRPPPNLSDVFWL